MAVKKKIKKPSLKVDGIQKLSDNTTIERYDGDKGPSKEALETAFHTIDFLKSAFEKILAHERQQQGDKFDLHKFVFDFASNIVNLVKHEYPEIEDAYLGHLKLTKEARIYIISFMNTCSCLPLSILLTEWYQTMHPEEFEEPDADGIFEKCAPISKSDNKQIVN